MKTQEIHFFEVTNRICPRCQGHTVTGYSDAVHAGYIDNREVIVFFTNYICEDCGKRWTNKGGTYLEEI